MIQTVKQNELARREYHILPAALMDAFDEGEAKGSHQAKIETAKKSSAIRLICGKYRKSNRPK
ncbi:hypothetical protein TREVI0001_2191 [Treponema vincentii ATCC 35580]|uniref:Uncharacterized protein n=1 Tax=Treponema vincentii ATCC 35580 TaxID=596324 RepID=C8PPS0_9SPIR|nr:hypothetical protein [Treponema vincentii]EEV20613.1 hypothetical protein TREVI0001_2191 [Treponema vincentii ATCC 35580]